MEQCKYHEAIDTRVERVEHDVKDLSAIVDKIRNRLPLWATITMSLLMAAIGWLIKN